MRRIAVTSIIGLLFAVGCGGEPCSKAQAENTSTEGAQVLDDQNIEENCVPSEDILQGTRETQGVKCTPCGKVGTSSCGKCGARKKEVYYSKVCWMEGSPSPAYNVFCYAKCIPCY